MAMAGRLQMIVKPRTPSQSPRCRPNHFDELGSEMSRVEWLPQIETGNEIESTKETGIPSTTELGTFRD